MSPFVKISLLYIFGIVCFPLFENVKLPFSVALPQLLFCLLFIFLFLAHKKINKRNLSTILISLALITFGIYSAYNSKSFINQQVIKASKFINKDAKAIIEISSISETSFGHKINATLLKIYSENKPIHLNEIDIFIYCDSIGNLKPNNTYISQIRLEPIKQNQNPSTTNFKEIFYKQGIHYQAKFAKNYAPIELTPINENLKTKINHFRNFLLKSLQSKIKNDNNFAIIAALTLGDKSYLKKSTKTIFSNTGSIHILAVSGLHVGLIYSIVLSILMWLPKDKHLKIIYLIISLITIFSYSMMTGMGTSVTRASLMIAIYLIGRSFGKFTSIYNYIGIAAFFILLFKPFDLFTISFQFSFLALISILLFQARISQLIIINNKIGHYIWQLISVSIAAQILIAPLLIFYFNQISLYFWISGIIAVPLAFLILLATIIYWILHFLGIEYLAHLTSFLLDQEVSFLFNSMSYINELPYCSAKDLFINAQHLVAIYISIILGTFYLKYKNIVYVYLILITLSLHAIYDIQHKIKNWEAIELVVYHLYKKSHILVRHNGKLNHIFSQNINDEALDKLLFKYRKNHLIRNENKKCSKSNFDHYFKVQDKSFVINPTGNYKIDSCSIDFVILTEKIKSETIFFFQTHDIGKVILDGQLNNYQKNKIIQQLKEIDLKFHDTKSEGAFLIKFQK